MKTLVLTLALCSTTALGTGLAMRTHAWSVAAGAIGGGLISLLLSGAPHGHAIVGGACFGASVSLAVDACIEHRAKERERARLELQHEYTAAKLEEAAAMDELTPEEKRIVDRLLERLPRNR